MDYIKKKIEIGKRYHGEDRLLIGYGIDQNYWRPAIVSMVSCLQQDVSLEFIIGIDTIDDSQIAVLNEISEKYRILITVYIIDKNYVADMPIHHKAISAATYYRLVLYNSVIDYEKMLYIDADIMCLSSLNKMKNISLADNIAAVVPDLEKMQSHRLDLGMKSDSIYFNSGVMLVNLDMWRKEKYNDKIKHIMQTEQEKIIFEDQDLLNIALDGKVMYLPTRYNMLCPQYCKKEDVTLIHFANHPKPWSKYWCLSTQCVAWTRSIYKGQELKMFGDNKKINNENIHFLKWIIKKMICSRFTKYTQ